MSNKCELMCDKINAPIAVFRGCTLPETLHLAKIIAVGLMVGCFLLGIGIVGLKLEVLLYSLCVATFLLLPTCWIVCTRIGKLKHGKPDKYFEQKIIIWRETHVPILEKNPFLVVRTGKWSVIRYAANDI